jgi:hypothetical protein
VKVHIYNGYGVTECGRRSRTLALCTSEVPPTCRTCIYNRVRRTPTGGQS